MMQQLLWALTGLRRSASCGLVMLLMSMMLVAPSVAQTVNDLQDLDRRTIELIRAGKKAEASFVAQQAVDLAVQQLGATHPIVAQRLDNLALTLRMQRKFSEAEPLLQRSLSMREQIFGNDDPDICQGLTNLAVLYEAQGRLGDVEPLLARSLSIRERALGSQHPVVGQSLHELAKLYKQQGRADEAKALFDRAVAILGPGHPAAIMVLINDAEYEKAARLLGVTNVREGDRAAAESAVRRTFWGQVDNLRWTSVRVDRDNDPRLMVIQGEATHRNEIWQLFEVDMVPDGSAWKMRAVRALPLAWK
jgi:tetratricopeptide (TPR) repeat protein